MSGDGYTGLKRRKQTPWSVAFGDALVSRLIAVGGIGTIAAILLVVVVLVGTAFPLFQSARVGVWTEFENTNSGRLGVDEYGLIAWTMGEDGSIEARALSTGGLLADFGYENESKITSSFLSIDRRTLVVGHEDGTIRMAELEYEIDLLAMESLPEEVKVSRDAPLLVSGDAVYQWFDSTGVRRVRLADVVWSSPKKLGDAAITAIDYLPDDSANRLSSSTRSYALAICGTELIFAEIRTKTNRMTRKTTEDISTTACELQSRSVSGIPLNIMLINGVDHALLTWPSGTIDRYSLRDGKPIYAESGSGLIGQGELTCAAPLLARQTLLCGSDDGRLLGWMVTKRLEMAATANDRGGADDYQLSLTHEVKVSESGLTTLASSEQTHLAVASDRDNNISLVYTSTDSLLRSSHADLSSDVKTVGMDPSGKILIASTATTIGLADVDIAYPEASWRGFFGKVWYEGHEKPKYIWQSSSGSEKSEIKLSLIPLVFGTLKATVYAMVISIPLAVLAAIYTSEFLSASARSRVKPIIELMASLPSVVLGYVAALVVAPYLQDNLITFLVGLFVLPLTFILAGNFWNLLPLDRMVRFEKYRLPAMILCLPFAYFASLGLGAAFENLWFGGNLVGWIGNQQGPATGGWILLLIPLLSAVAVFVLTGPLSEMTRRRALAQTPRQFASMALLRLLSISAAVLVCAWLLGSLMNTMGWDLRGSFFTSYQDRNALLVGGALGFCVIPIIYTISDDALQAVPKQLRSASLGCGATPWQTTTRVVVPAAMSGLFSAVMIGLGRAVGETMVVLMAAGNTPLMEWNPFNGFRTLSATLATELPEAAKGSTHFRTLFLAALLLFFFTLIANTVAEFVRIRFRKRASQL